MYQIKIDDKYCVYKPDIHNPYDEDYFHILDHKLANYIWNRESWCQEVVARENNKKDKGDM